MVREAFERQIRPYMSEMKSFCTYVAGTPWDAEDLFQEALIRAYRSLPRLEKVANVKSYLFKIISNTWIDHCRKVVPTESMDEAYIAEANDESDFLEVEDALKRLTSQLPPLQCVVLVLRDVYSFSAAETAQMINTNENAVKSALHRARRNLRLLKTQHGKKQAQVQLNPRLIDAFLHAFRRNNPIDICRAYQALIDVGYDLERFTHDGDISFLIHDPDGNVLMIQAHR